MLAGYAPAGGTTTSAPAEIANVESLWFSDAQ